MYVNAAGIITKDAELKETKTHKLPFGMARSTMVVTSQEHADRWGRDSTLYLELAWRAGPSQRGALKLRKGAFIWVCGNCEPKMMGQAGHNRRLVLDLWVDQWIFLGTARHSIRSEKDPHYWPDVVDVTYHTKSDGSVPEQGFDSPPPPEKLAQELVEEPQVLEEEPPQEEEQP